MVDERRLCEGDVIELTKAMVVLQVYRIRCLHQAGDVNLKTCRRDISWKRNE